jgi:1-deoxy-D-xylulose-5-phosphate synthase
LKPLDETLLHEICTNYKTIITVEDGTIIGGLGSAVMEFAMKNEYFLKIVRLGIPDAFIEQGTLAQLHNNCGFDKEGIINTIKKTLLCQ